jgi:hypothetical protein
MAEYQRVRTPSGKDCEVRETTGPGQDGRRWHVRVKSRKHGPETFYLWAARSLPMGASEDRIWRGVLNAIDDELARDRSGVPPDQDVQIRPQDFGYQD